MNEYVLKHDFGYGQDEELPIKKLKLRNFQDCKDYVIDILQQAFVATLNENKLYFPSDKSIVEVSITKVKK